ncbi:hypothetical protein QM996_02435 [Sinorhizobium chiapasense]
METAMVAVCLWLLKKIAEDIYNWLKPLVLAKFKRPKRYQIMFI